jgi:AraC-like DNA-binding protein
VALRLTTDDVGAAERFSYWRELICDTFVGLDAERPARGFTGTLVSAPLGPLRLTEVRSVAQHVVRSPRQIERGRGDDVLVSVQRSGRGLVRQDGREALLRPGDLALYDAARPYTLTFDAPFAQAVFQLPRELLTERLGRLDGLTAARVAAPPELLAISDGERALDLLGTALGARLGRPASPAAAHRRAIRLYVERNLGDPSLTPASIAATHALSPRYVHRLWGQGDGETLGRHILRRRLERCRADLADPWLSQRTVTEIAFRWGFRSPAHFSRAYRAHFGVAPSEARQVALGQARREPAI